MKNFFDKFYASAYGRLFRRFWVTGLAAVVPLFFAKVGTDPATFLDNMLLLSGNDVAFFGRIFIGAGMVACLDKLRREWENLPRG